jgi:hypothetical protein
MTDVDRIRVLIADPVQVDRAVVAGDGVTTVFQLPNAPVVVGSLDPVTVGGVPTAPAGIDYELGLVTMPAAPGVGDELDITYRWTLLSDNTLADLLTDEGAVKLAAAQALDIIANSEVLIQKRISVLDLQTDGPAVANALREGAQRLRDQWAAQTGTTAEDFAGAFDVAEVGWDATTRNELRLRGFEALES